EAGFSWTLPEALDLPDSSGVESLAFYMQVRLTPDGQPYVQSLTYRSGDITVGMERQDGGDKYNLVPAGVLRKIRRGRPWELPAPMHFYGFPKEVANCYANTE